MCTFLGWIAARIGENLCPLKLEQGCFLHGSARSSSPALFLSFPSPLLLHTQSCALHFLWSQPGRWEMQHLPKLCCTSVLQCSVLQWGIKQVPVPNSGITGGRVQPLHKSAHRAAAKLGATPNWECGLWVHSSVGIPAQKYEFPSKVVNSKVKICAVSILTVWLLIVLRDACKYPFSWIKA